MTKTRLVLQAMLADGEPWTHARIRKEFGLTSNQASTIARSLVKGGYVKAAPVQYAITDDGRKHVESRTKEQEARLARKALAMAKKRAAERAAPIVLPVAESDETLVAQAMFNRRPLDLAWTRIVREAA